MRVSVNEITGDGSAIFLDGTFVPSLWVQNYWKSKMANSASYYWLLALAI
jgi:hypothetical protein